MAIMKVVGGAVEQSHTRLVHDVREAALHCPQGGVTP